MERGPNRHNWSAAFLEYLNGSSFADISSLLCIPLHRITRRARDERWAKLVTKLTPPALDSPGDDREKTIERIQQNRERNFASAQKLQADVVEQVDKLREGSLIVKRQTATGQTIELPAGLKERVDLANYARTVAELSYRALGDGLPGHGTGAITNEHGAITVIIPDVIAAPRDERGFQPNLNQPIVDVANNQHRLLASG